MANGKWNMANPTLFVQKRRHRWLEAVCFPLPEKGHFFGAQSPKRPTPLFASKREFCSRLARLWWSGRSAHAEKRATERAFHQGYQGRSPCLVGGRPSKSRRKSTSMNGNEIREKSAKGPMHQRLKVKLSSFE
jgi:hypothetical protein